MILKYIKANPSGNTTVLIFTQIPQALHSSVANIIMSQEYLAAEQVAYIVPSQLNNGSMRMEMMGGEFCGNASRSFAAWLIRNKITEQFSPHDQQKFSLDIEVSGCKELLNVFIETTESIHTYNVSISMPLPNNIINGANDLLGEYSIVTFDGITHVILWNREANKQDVGIARKFLEDEAITSSAFGVLFMDMKTDTLTPVVCINKVGSLIWENSCGSGCTAIAAAISSKEKSYVNRTLHQPGGDLFVRSEWANNKVQKIYLSGPINFTSEGTLFIDDKSY